MSPCPDLDSLQGLLANALPAGERETVRDHVRTCPACQGRLDRLTPETRATLDPPCEAGLRRLLDAPAAPPARLGPYRIDVELGRGGMGVVYKGYDAALGRAVAIKVLRPELGHAEGRDRFLREARAVAQLRHENVVRVHAVADPADGLPYFVMEYVAGPTLAELVHSRGPLDPREAAALAAGVADGLAAAHAVGLVHRDVKPGNVLLDPAGGVPKLVDFGLVKRLDDGDVTRPGAVVGTPNYLAPEQVSPKVGPVGPATDVHGLGALLYELLTGRPPFLGGELTDTLRQVLTEEPIPVRRLRPGVPADLETICARALAKVPGRRYASAAALAADLRRWLAGEPIHARPVGRAERLWLWCKRSPRTALLAATALGLLLVLAIGGPIAAYAIAGARRDSEANRKVAEAERERFAEALFLVVVEVPRRFEFDPGTLPVRKALLENARPLVEGMEAGPGRDYFRCLVHLAEGGLLQRDLRGDEARAEFTRAADLARDLTDAAPRREPYWRCLYVAESRLGDLAHDGGKPDAAAGHYRASLEALARSFELRKPTAHDHRERSLCLNKFGRVALQRDDPAEAARLFRQSLDELDQFATAAPWERDQLSADRRYTFGQLGEALVAAADLDGAAVAYQQSLVEAVALAKAAPRDPARQHSLATTWERIGGLHLRRYALAEADAAYREAVAVREVVAGMDDTGEARRNLAVALSLRGDGERRRGDVDAARASYRASLEHLEALAAGGRTDRLVRNGVLLACAKLAEVEQLQEQFGRAARWLERADDRLAEWAKAGPVDPGLFLTREGIAAELRVYAAVGESFPGLEAALAKYPDLADDVLPLHGLALARRDDHAAAAAVAKRLADRNPSHPERLKTAARIYARCAAAIPTAGATPAERALRDGYEERAAASLVAAMKQQPALAQTLYLLPEFDAIRGGEAFRAAVTKGAANP